MNTKIIEATNGPRNHGKFMIMWPTEEWKRQPLVSPVGGVPLLASIGWDWNHLIVFDLQTCEGAAFLPGGYAHADLEKHRIWVCPLFEPFLEWLYGQRLRDAGDLNLLPDRIDLADAPFLWAGHRRPGPEGAQS